MNHRCAMLVATFAVAACSSDETPAASGDSGAMDSGDAQLDSSAPPGDAAVTDGAADVAVPDGASESGADAQDDAGDDAAPTDGGADDGSFESSSPADGGCPTPVDAAAVRETNSASYASKQPRIAWSGTQAAVVFFVSSTTTSGGANVHVALLNSDGSRATSGDVVLTSFADGSTSNAYPSDIVWTGSGWGVLWTQTVSANTYHIMFQQLAADGTPQGTPADITALTTGPTAPASWLRLGYGASQGFALVSTASGSADFQRLGADGAHPQPVNQIPQGGGFTFFPAIAAAPSGGWGVLVGGNSGLLFQPVNADGSITVTATILTTMGSAGASIAYDGSTWVGTWTERRDNMSPITDAIVIARGATLSNRLDVATAAEHVSVPLGLSAVTASGSEVSLVWESRTGLSGPDEGQLARFRAPTDPTAALVWLTNPVTVVNTYTIDLYTLDATVTGPTSLLSTWADTRWGHDEIYAQATDFLSCQ